MSDRGLPTEGAPACPFVAFEDDRDGRATAPDHRHRCFAEPRPAPRALAHQEAYCLSSAFPVCPTFQDWARREAAAARPAPSAGGASREEPPQGQPMPPLERDPYRPPADLPQAPPSRRSPQRDWAAPPPWAGEEVAAAGAVAGAAAYGDDRFDDDGGAPDQYAPPRDDERYAPPAARPAPPPPPVAPASPPDAYPAESRGLAGSPAYRLAGPDPDEPLPARPTGSHPDDDLDDWAAGAAGAAVAGSAAASRATPPPSRRSTPPPRQPSTRDQVSKPGAADPQELFGPAWERPRRYEAYPTLRTRIGLPALGGLPRVAIWALILLLVALFLFLFGPGLLGFGDDDQGIGGASPSPAATAEATEEPAPTEPPAPTPQVHVVAKGETMSKIAKKYGLTVEEIMAANPQIKNPNKIDIGDEITIPVPVEDDTTGDGTVEGEEPPAP